MKRLIFLAPLMAIGCGGLVPIAPPPIMTDDQCRAEATSSRDVRLVSREANSDNYANMRQVQSDRNTALREVYETCMRAHGRPFGGGVEPVLRTN
ncbi:hypothetical protein [Roseococcus sp.]|uniref:hypothetical protein n=1 Tax=Roseococcus sp. TaxID=2109646 RepID=UPI003BAAE42F